MAEDATPAPSVRPSYLRCLAEGPNAGRWTTDFAEDPRNVPYPNFGCAQQRNLAAMVENPADLVQPRGETPAYTARRTIALEKYRKGEYPGTIYPNENKGKISDVGQ